MSKFTKYAPLFANKAAEEAYYEKVLGIQSANMLAYWPVWEASGAVADNIEGTAARDGAYTGVDLGQPGIGDGNTCPWWDGANDYCNIYSTSLRDAFNGAEGTIACWAKVNSAAVWTDGLQRNVMSFYVGGTENISIAKLATANTLYWVYKAGGVSLSRTSTAYNLITWLHLAMNWSQSSDIVRCYANGVQVGADMTGLGVWADVLQPLSTVIGSGNKTPQFVWHGWLAHVPVWSTPLTGAQITDLATV